MFSLDYLLYVVLYSGILWLSYSIIWRINPVLTGRRPFLILSAILPLVLPLIRLPVSSPSSFHLPTVLLPEVRVGASPVASAVHNTGANPLLIIYLVLSIAILLRYSFSYLRLSKMLKKGNTVSRHNYTLIQNTGVGPGTLGRIVFLPGDSCEAPILRHEIAHIRAGHRFDLLLLILVQSLSWINPFIWIILRELKTVHELEADAEVATTCDPEYYQSLLLSQAFSVPSSLLIHSFFNHPIKRRIVMLQSNKSTRRTITITAASLLMVGLVTTALFAQTVHKKEKGNTPDPSAATDNKTFATPGAPSKKHDEWILRSYKKTGNPKNISEQHSKSTIAPDGRTIYNLADKMPEFNGDLSAFLMTPIHYPDSARAHNQEGRSVIKFIVDETGKPTAPELVRSSGFPLLDEEALKVLRGMPDWKPGMQAGIPVNVYFYLPITFKLDN